MESKTVAEAFERLSDKRECDSRSIANALGGLEGVMNACEAMESCTQCRKKWFGILADVIERETAEAVSAAMERTMAEHMWEWAVENGLPAFREKESFKAWLDRCFLKLPRYTDGEPVYFGDGTDKLHGVEKFIYLRSGECCQMQDAYGNMQTVYAGQRVQRPAPKALGADGVPIEVGETVWDIFGNGPITVKAIGPAPDDDGLVVWDADGVYTSPYLLTHKDPDTQERIDADALKSVGWYWDCAGNDCEDCPSKVCGKSPARRYGVDDCMSAMVLDLLRRQRELDAREGGAK